MNAVDYQKFIQAYRITASDYSTPGERKEVFQIWRELANSRTSARLQ